MQVMESLSERYSTPLLSYLLVKGKCLKTDLQVIVSNIQTLDKLLIKMEKDGLVRIEKKVIGRRTFEISLTDKGKQVAEQLMNADLAARGTLKRSFFSRSQQVLMFLGTETSGKATVSQIKDEIPGSYDDLEELKKMKLITSKIDNDAYPPVNYVVLTEQGEEIVNELGKCENIVKRGNASGK